MRLRRILLVATAIVFVTAAVIVGVFVSTGNDREPTSLPSWYPLANDDGDPAFADFENHVPCTIDDPPVAECQRVKFGIVLYRDAITDEPTTYLMSIIRVAVSDDRETHAGTWSISRGTGLDPDATIYQLDAGAPDHLRGYWPIGDDILFLLDEERMPRVGNAGYGFALNRIPVGQRTEVPE